MIAVATIGACGPASGPSDSQVPAGPKSDLTQGVYGEALPQLSIYEAARFTDGRKAFQKPESIAAGLGPVYNENFCSSCHDAPPAIGGTNQRLETRFGRRDPDGGYDPLTAMGGPLLHNNGIGAVDGGYVFVGEVVPGEANVIASRRTQPLFGLGLVDATPDIVFSMLAQAQGMTAPQAAGRPAMVVDLSTGGLAIGKFGWKANDPTLFQFAGDAALNEMGITSPQFPNEICPQGNCAVLAYDPDPTVNDPTGQTVSLFSDFMRFLGPPPAPQLDGGTVRGSELFESVGCAVCHVPTLVTGPNSVPALDEVAYHPYSDFLLHDMGTLGDGIVQADAQGTEMRTQPLWGLSVQSELLHDGRATTVTAAIAAHDGQGASARDSFAALNATDREALLDFLSTL